MYFSNGVGNLYVADSDNQTIRRISPTGAVSTIAGQVGKQGYQDSTSGGVALFGLPRAIAVDGAGYLYVTDTNTIRRINTSSISFPVETLAGLFTRSGYVDGLGNGALFNELLGIAVDASGNLYLADDANKAIRLIQRALP